MGIGYLDRVVFERDARVFGEGGRGKGRHRVVPDGPGYFTSGWGKVYAEVRSPIISSFTAASPVGGEGGWER